jgi:molybdopterin converting factor subunit 1
MQLNVLLFASYAEALGAPSVALTMREGSSVDDVLNAVRAMAPGRGLPPALVAVNQEYASPRQVVIAGDEVAIIPPVAGG